MQFGIIGTNFISDRFARALSRTASGCAAVYSRRAETGEAFAAKHGINKVFTALDAFLSSSIDAVYIASPNALHKEQAISALRAGKHVLVEKPAAPSLREWEQIRHVADRAGKTVMEAMRPVHAAAWQTVRELLPRLGTLRSVTLDFCQYSSRYDAFRAGQVMNAFDPSLSNAALLDIGIYPLAVAAMLFGMPGEVYGRSVRLSGGFEGGGAVLLSYPGFTVSVTYSKIASSLTPSVFLGEDGGLTVDKVSEPHLARLFPRGKEAEEYRLLPADMPDNMHEEIRAFEAAVAGKGCDEAWRISDITLSIMDEIRRQNGIVFPSDAKM